jgi:hypothetical protein
MHLFIYNCNKYLLILITITYNKDDTYFMKIIIFIYYIPEIK